MRIALNLLYLIPGVVGGTETYAVSLIDSLSKIDRSNEYFIFVNLEGASLSLSQAANFEGIVCPIQAVNRPLRYAWEQIALPIQLRRYRIDLVHSLGYVGPLMCHSASVVTIPDVNYLALKGTMPESKRKALGFFSTQAARRATHVITISNFSKNEICGMLKIPKEKVTVTTLGPGWAWAAESPASWEVVEECYGLPNSYVVAFGGGSIHKNISRLIAAFELTCRYLPHHLVLLGHVAPEIERDVKALSPAVAKRVMTLGYVPRAHIASILAHADLFVFPSLYEGFGLPVLEAQQAGVPVACSTAGSLPEVAGEGAVFFDPSSVKHIAQVIEACLRDACLREKLRELGNHNLKRFSWEQAAKQTLAVYEGIFN